MGGPAVGSYGTRTIGSIVFSRPREPEVPECMIGAVTPTESTDNGLRDKSPLISAFALRSPAVPVARSAAASARA